MVISQLEEFIPLPEAVAQYKLPHRTLSRLVAEGEVRAIQLPDGQIAVSARDAASHGLRRNIQRTDFRHLRGQTLTTLSASIKYSVPQGSLNRWAHAGHIRIVSRSRHALQLDEADVAYCAAIYHGLKRAGNTQGRRITRLFEPA